MPTISRGTMIANYPYKLYEESKNLLASADRPVGPVMASLNHTPPIFTGTIGKERNFCDVEFMGQVYD